VALQASALLIAAAKKAAFWAALAALLLAAGYMAGRCHGPSSAVLAARADTLDRRAAALDSLLAVRHRADSIPLAEAARGTSASQTRAVALGDTASRLATTPPPPTPDSCAPALAALKGVTLRLAAAARAAFDSSAREIALLKITVAARDSAIGALQGQRDESRILTHRALAIVRPWPLWRKILVGVSCVTTGYFVTQKAVTPAAVAGVGCLATIAL
jgi:hypothetical protein